MSKSKQSQLYTLITVFFFWGFIAASNGIFIPFCKQHFNLTQFQSQLIDLTFYGGYFIGSVLLFVYSRVNGNDLLNRIGYKKGIILGLFISTIGALAIIPAVNAGSFGFILTAFFIVALGFSLNACIALHAYVKVITWMHFVTCITRMHVRTNVCDYTHTHAPLHKHV
jgi:FHS family L-fucose permease-like MFS transporter